MVALAEELQLEIEQRGYAHVSARLDLQAYRHLAESVGQVVAGERIALRSGAHAYVAKPGPVPLHTDHPEVDVIGWLCEEQDADDGASLLLDARPIVERLAAEERALLHAVELACPPLAGGPPTLRWPVLRSTPRGTAVFCSPWLKSANNIAKHQVVLDRFRSRLSVAAKEAAVLIRLAPGDALFVDNRRILHGRRAIAQGSRRCLHRLWLRTYTK